MSTLSLAIAGAIRLCASSSPVELRGLSEVPKRCGRRAWKANRYLEASHPIAYQNTTTVIAAAATTGGSNQAATIDNQNEDQERD